jgi:hypothetical protein
MQMKKSYLAVMIVNKFIVVCALFLTACGPSQATLATLTSTPSTAIAASWTKTPTPTPPPSHIPTITTTPTPSNTPTPEPKNTPEYGTFSAQAPIGMTITRYSEGYKPEFTIKMAATVLEVK